MRYSILGHTGLRVSALVLGTGNFGTGWGHGAEPAEALAIFNAYRAAGGNFVDTANIYQRGESETLVGEFIAAELDDIVRAGKALHVGLSNFPAWRIATSVTIAELRGWAPVQAVQTEYSLVERTAERELVPMAAGFGLAMLGWSPLGGGLLTGKYRRGETGRRA